MPFKEHSPQFVVSLFSVRGEPVEPREHLPFILRQAQDERNAIAVIPVQTGIQQWYAGVGLSF